MNKRTKIIITLGPASSESKTLSNLINAGVDLVRLNFSHGTIEQRKKQFKTIKQCAQQQNKNIGILADLQGPKIRITSFAHTAVELKAGDEFILDLDCDSNSGTKQKINIDYPNLINEVSVEQMLCLDDGKIVLQIQSITSRTIVTKIITGGVLSSNKGINLVGGGLSAGAITEKDRKDLQAACDLGVDYIALSFVKDSHDINLAKNLIKQCGSTAQILTKIERVEAVENIEEIINLSDGIMVARGDLAIEVGDAEVPAIQKKLIHMAKQAAKPVIVATQMMESMISSPTPTRAEISDVANAVLDGADAVMLSAESAVGEYPVLTVEAMVRTCMSVEQHKNLQFKTKIPSCLSRVDQAIATATVYTANKLSIKAIVALTESGMTPLWMSNLQTNIPICALSRHSRTLGLMSLYRGVCPVYFDVTKVSHSQVNIAAIKALKQQSMVTDGDLVIITKGDYLGIEGGSNAMKIITVGDLKEPKEL